MDTFSFSRLSLYDDCPRRFYYRYILALEEKEGVPLWLGRAIHKAIERKIVGDSFDSALIQGMAAINFNQTVPFNDLKFLLNNLPANVQGNTEQYFKLALNEEGTLFLQGYIDLQNGPEITDWKSNRKIYSVNDTAQIGLYSWAIHQLYGYEQVKGRLYFLRFRKESAFVYDRSTMELARQWALQLAQEILIKLQQVQSGGNWCGLFPSVRSSKCSHCPFAIACYRSQSNPIIKTFLESE
ncbi:PD-(D/E)XK nuclease superfamily protein [Ureibacillus xyleni]|uniref:PD-(D/E)XK nuclease superfamily protein n=1 Tax=Ureibacillus xyleni TaxID=614648 RepID=A0A285TIH2_9BACL|nr:PD-(D/E)XK nuclease family protein [Ureibacillus xyleni]SOC22025.1 PD-(D/E)XK nuclease superfamily protein [Ureibacillus xyleni]